MPKRWVVGGVWAVLVSVGLLVCGPSAKAEQPMAPGRILISDVIISGNNHRMSTEQIKAHLHTRPGKEYKPDIVDEDVRDLYRTNQFSIISTLLQEDGIGRVKIYFVVREMPNIVQQVTFLAAKHIKPDELQNITGVRPGAPLNPNLNRQGCQRIMDKYAEMGRPFSDCQLLKGGDPVDTEVVYQITEGIKVKVRDIKLVGNEFVTSGRLMTQLKSSPDWHHRPGSTYNKHLAEADLGKLYEYYRSFGFQDVIICLETQRSDDGREVTLIFHIKEGERSRKKDDWPIDG